MVSPGTESPPLELDSCRASLARTDAPRAAEIAAGPCLGLGATAARRDGADCAAAGFEGVGLNVEGHVEWTFFVVCSRAGEGRARQRRSVDPPSGGALLVRAAKLDAGRLAASSMISRSRGTPDFRGRLCCYGNRFDRNPSAGQPGDPLVVAVDRVIRSGSATVFSDARKPAS